MKGLISSTKIEYLQVNTSRFKAFPVPSDESLLFELQFSKMFLKVLYISRICFQITPPFFIVFSIFSVWKVEYHIFLTVGNRSISDCSLVGFHRDKINILYNQFLQCLHYVPSKVNWVFFKDSVMFNGPMFSKTILKSTGINFKNLQVFKVKVHWKKCW